MSGTQVRDRNRSALESCYMSTLPPDHAECLALQLCLKGVGAACTMYFKGDRPKLKDRLFLVCLL